ncbi:MAG: YicC/YloC family endoribonuclease [Pseudomonadota bacterium]
MRSMTGFGRAELTIGSHQLTLEIKSVNHRFLDLRFRMPPAFGGWEAELSEEIRKFCERGSLDVSLRQKWAMTQGNVTGNTRFAIDDKALESFEAAIQLLQKKTHHQWSLSLNDILQTGKIIVPLEENDERNLTLKELLPLFSQALQSLLDMRTREGNNLKTVMLGIISEMKTDLEQITQWAPAQTQRIKEKLENRLSQWKLSTPVDPHRLEWEVALMAEKSDIKEEIDRLTGHFQAFTEATDSAKPVGRKLDFLTQELHREVNTIASKTSLIEITQLTVRLKSNIEKLREQVQNVE